jgi:hypothetical protein
MPVNAISPLVTKTTRVEAPFVTPVDTPCDWIDLTDPVGFDGASNNATINASTHFRTTLKWLDITGFGGLLDVRLKYPTGASGITDPIVQVFGQDSAGNLQRLYTSSLSLDWDPAVGAGHEKTLTTATSTDFSNGTWKTTTPITFDCSGNRFVAVAVKRIIAGTGITGASIQARAK